MSYYLFESLYATLAVAIIGSAVLLFVGRNMEPSRRGRLWLSLLGLVVALYFTERFVVTQREAVRIQLDRFVRALTDKNAEAVAAAISRDYHSPDFDRQALLDWIHSQLQSIDVVGTYFRRCDITVTGDTAVMQLSAAANIHFQGFSGLHTGEWTLTWSRDADTWQIDSITVHRIDEQPATRMQEIRP